MIAINMTYVYSQLSPFVCQNSFAVAPQKNKTPKNVMQIICEYCEWYPSALNMIKYTA